MTSFGGHSHAYQFPQKSMARYQTTEMYSEAWSSNPKHFLGTMDQSAISLRVSAEYCKAKGRRKRVFLTPKIILPSNHNVIRKPKSQNWQSKRPNKSERQETLTFFSQPHVLKCPYPGEKSSFAMCLITSRRLSYFLLHLLNPEETCTKIDQSQGKIRACCYNWDGKILYEMLSFSLYMAFSLGLLSNLD